MHFLLRGTLVMGAALALSGCASLSNVQTADTLGKGNLQVGIEPGLWGGVGSGAAFAPHVDAAVRYGVSDGVDIGIRGGSSFLELQGKFLLTKPGDPNLAVSIAPTVGGIAAVGGGASAGLLNIGVPVLIGLKTSGGSEFVIGPRLQNILTFGGTTTDSASGFILGVGGSLGFFWRATDNFGLLPEVSAVYPLVGAASASGVGTGLQGLGAGLVLMQFKLGVIIGRGRRPPSNPDLEQSPPPPPPMPAGEPPPPPPPPASL